MNNEKFSMSLYKSPFIPTNYFYSIRKQKELNLFSELLDKMENGQFYTIKIERFVESDRTVDFMDGYKDSEIFRTELHVGKVKSLQMRWKPIPRKLTIKERLKVLFTGDYIYRMEIE